MSKLSKALRDIYTSNDKYTVLQMLDEMITLLEEHEPGFYKHTIKVTYDTGGHTEQHTFIVYNNIDTPASPMIECSDIVGGFSSNSGFGIYATRAGKVTYAHFANNTVTYFNYTMVSIEDTVMEVA